MALRAKKPHPKDKRLKFFLYGPAGCGKTIGCIQLFPHAVIIDTEHGCDQYHDLIIQQKSVLLQTTDIDEITQEILSLLSSQHDYKSLIIDPVTMIYQGIQERWNDIFREQALKKGDLLKVETEDWGFGYWSKVKRHYKRLTNLLYRLDMNVAMTSHQKVEYSNDSTPRAIGVTYDSMKGSDYFFDVVFRMSMDGGDRTVTTLKQRQYPNAVFQPVFKWDPEAVRKAWGEDIIKRKATPEVLATKGQLKKMKGLIEALNIPTEDITRWKDRADVHRWEDLSKEKMEKFLKWLESKLPQNNVDSET